MALDDDLSRAAEAAASFAAPDEQVEAVLAAEPAAGTRVYVCAYAGRDRRAWLALDERGEPVTSRALVREAVSIAVLCEIAGEAADDAPPRLASPAYLDAVGSTEAIVAATPIVESLTRDVEASYKAELS